MAAHHTKDKGDLGVAKVFADLVEKGYALLFPATEHAPFDLVAWDGERFIRLQVKYRSARRGVIKLQFRSVWNDKHGTHVRPMDKASVDVVALYCPEVDQCFYVDPSRLGGGVTLRLQPAANCQEVGVRYADQFRQVPGIAPVSRSLDESEVSASSSTLVR
jgi:hypothetical protein